MRFSSWSLGSRLARAGRPAVGSIRSAAETRRAPPELVFDAGFGELFIIRVAGNVISPEVMGSLQYAGVHLETPLFVVLGHEGCGAVQAALRGGAQERSRIALLLDRIVPGLAAVDRALPPELQLSAAIEANVRWSMRQSSTHPKGALASRQGSFACWAPCTS